MSFSPKMCNDLTVKWNDLTWNEVTVKPNIRSTCIKCPSHYHELISRVLPVGRLFLTESIVVSVSICEIAYMHNPRIPTNPLSGSRQPPLL